VISYVGMNSAAASSVTLPVGWEVGDLAIAHAYRDGGSNTSPTAADGWTDIATSNGVNLNSRRIAYRILESGDTTTGPNLGATQSQVIVLRGAHSTSPIGANSSGGGLTATPQLPALTVTDTSGTGWLIGFAGVRTDGTNSANAKDVSGMATRSGDTVNLGLHIKSGNTSNFSASNYSSAIDGTDVRWRSDTVEVLAAPTEPDIESDLVSHLPLQSGDGTTTVPDSVATDSTLAGGETTANVLTSGPGGSLANAYELDGNDSINTGQTSIGGVDLFADDDPFSVAWWSKLPSSTSGTFVAKASGTAGNRTLQIYVSSGASKPAVLIRGTISTFDVGIDDDAWHHWTLSFDGITPTLYKDGVPVGNPTIGTASVESSETIKFGARTNTSAVFLTGALADLRIYARGLVQQDVEALVALASSTFKPWFYQPEATRIVA
jgi:Concanavalin A-like lectin/glucanases superfamily